MGSLHRQVAVLALDEKLNCFDFCEFFCLRPSAKDQGIT